MSIVVWDGKTLAADKQGTVGDLRLKTTKIAKLSTGEILGWVGAVEHGLALVNWYANGCKIEEWPETQKGEEWGKLIVITKGKAYEYEQLPIRQLVQSVPAAWGSGRDFALGALAMGADAIGAVKVACKFSTSCGMGIDSFRAS
jgi:ATP-dependent protease HslVU (ClpYQ) peptidase subunit